MSEDQAMHHLKENYTAAYGHLLEKENVNAYQLSKDKPVNEFEADMMLEALHRTDYIDHVSSSGGEQYKTEHFNIEQHQEILEEFNLL